MYTSREECMYFIAISYLYECYRKIVSVLLSKIWDSISSAILVYVSEVSFTVAGYLFVSACFFVSNELITYFTVNVVMVWSEKGML